MSKSIRRLLWPSNHIERDVFHSIRSLAARHHTSVSDLVATAVNQFLTAQESTACDRNANAQHVGRRL